MVFTVKKILVASLMFKQSLCFRKFMFIPSFTSNRLSRHPIFGFGAKDFELYPIKFFSNCSQNKKRFLTSIQLKAKNEPLPIDYAKFITEVNSPEEMETIGAFIAKDASPGDTITIRGDLGSGKTVFARGFVRTVMGDPLLSVTSPSYLLDNTYQAEDTGYIIHHMDLFRLAGEEDLDVLDLPTNLKTCINIIEWPERMGELEPAERLEVWLDILSEDERRVSLIAHGVLWSQKIIKMRQEFKK